MLIFSFVHFLNSPKRYQHCFRLMIDNEIVGSSPMSYFKIVVLGLCSSGKSTIIGHLVQNSGDSDKSTLGKFKKAQMVYRNFVYHVQVLFLDLICSHSIIDVSKLWRRSIDCIFRQYWSPAIQDRRNLR